MLRTDGSSLHSRRPGVNVLCSQTILSSATADPQPQAGPEPRALADGDARLYAGHYVGQEARGIGAVHDAMVERQ